MNLLDRITTDFVENSHQILGENLVGIYLHGSVAMGCFNDKKSDIDLLVVVNNDITDTIKQQYMQMVVELDQRAPEKGIELSIIKKGFCKPFIYPTPFELHFSKLHLSRYLDNPLKYVNEMYGVDRDLASHITVLKHRGRCLFGKTINDVFDDVAEEYFFDSIWNDVKDSKDEVLDHPVYIILNLCRVLAFKRDKVILSKAEGGHWGILNLPPKFKDLIMKTLCIYEQNGSIEIEKTISIEFSKYMLAKIQE